MREITLEEVVAAHQLTGVKPQWGQLAWVNGKGEITGGCALGVIGLVRGWWSKEDATEKSQTLGKFIPMSKLWETEEAVEEYGSDYIEGFFASYDMALFGKEDWKVKACASDEAWRGIEDAKRIGRKIREMRKAGGIPPLEVPEHAPAELEATPA